jgi:hypothetical protein
MIARSGVRSPMNLKQNEQGEGEVSIITEFGELGVLWFE